MIADLARVPAGWNHPAEKDSRQVNMLEHVLAAKPLHTLAGHAPIRRTAIKRDGPQVEILWGNPDGGHCVSPLRLGSNSEKLAEGQIIDLPDKNIFNYFAASGINVPACESSQ